MKQQNTFSKFLPKKLRHHFIRNQLNIPRVENRPYQFKLASSKEEYEAAFLLLKQSYVKQGKEGTGNMDIYCNPFHALPTTYVFIAKIEGRVVACATLYCESKLGIPSDNPYKTANDLSRTRGFRLCEVGDLSFGDDDEKQLLAFHLMKFIYEFVISYTNCNMICANFPKAWFEIFSAVFNFSTISAVYDAMPKISAVDIHGVLDLQKFPEWVKEKYQEKSVERNLYSFIFRERAPFEFPDKDKAQSLAMTMDVFKYIFETKTDVLKKVPLSALGYIRDMYRFYFDTDKIEGFKRVEARREFHRVRFSVDAALQTEYKTVLGKIFDISLQGIFFVSTEEIKMNEIYALVFKWDQQLFTVRTVPMWKNNGENRKYPKGYGLKFLDKNEQLIKLLNIELTNGTEDLSDQKVAV